MINKKLVITSLILSTVIIANGFYSTVVVYGDTKTIDEVKNEQSEVANKIKEVENETKRLQQEINKSQKAIDDSKDKEISLVKENYQLESEIEELSYKKTEKYNSIASVVKMKYEQKDSGYVSLLLESKSITNFFIRLEVISNIAKNNNDLINEIKELEIQLKEKSARLETQIEEIKQQSIIQQQEKERFEMLANERDAEKVQLVELQNELDSELDKLQKELAATSAGNGESYGGGIMAWPVPGYNYVSSYYGYRVHPVTGQNKLHKGIDIPAPAGQTVVAVNDGIVTMAGYNSSYGNLVVIDHGGGILTYYAHNTSMNVSVGQAVSKGQAISTVGSTGITTGNNMHFEVQVNGSFVDPMNYLQ